MTQDEWTVWVKRYIDALVGPKHDRDFIDEDFKAKVMARDFSDMVGSISDFRANPNLPDEARWPRNHLALLLEYADIRAAARKPKWSDPLKGQPAPQTCSPWNKWMLERGIISKSEFAKRERPKDR